MAEYIKREDALKAVDRVRSEIHKPHEKYVIGELLMSVFDSAFDACDRGINRIPTADVVEVVRCKDCVWWEARTFGSTIGRCENPRNGLVNEYSEETDFCSYGERKE